MLQSSVAWCQESELFEFFQEEARVITASRRPQPRERAPALDYCFTGRLQNLELGFDAFNALNDEHFEILPVQSILAQGQGGEIIGARRMLTLDYRF